jgi:hypothetical protein
MIKVFKGNGTQYEILLYFVIPVKDSETLLDTMLHQQDLKRV